MILNVFSAKMLGSKRKISKLISNLNKKLQKSLFLGIQLKKKRACLGRTYCSLVNCTKASGFPLRIHK